MRVGGRAVLSLPPQLAYGEAGCPPRIPPRTALKFDVELLAIASTAGSSDAPEPPQQAVGPKHHKPRRAFGSTDVQVF